MTYSVFIEQLIDCPCTYWGMWLGALFGIPVGFFLYMGIAKWMKS
jgi:hypothetical protein